MHGRARMGVDAAVGAPAAGGRASPRSGADDQVGVDAAVGAGGRGGLVHGRARPTVAIVDVCDRVFAYHV